MIANAKITVTGLVQGVGYRWFADRTARKFDLKGFVENRINGDVYLEVEGEEDQLKLFISELRVGPRGAHVSDIKVEWDPAHNMFINFKIRA